MCTAWVNMQSSSTKSGKEKKKLYVPLSASLDACSRAAYSSLKCIWCSASAVASASWCCCVARIVARKPSASSFSAASSAACVAFKFRTILSVADDAASFAASACVSSHAVRLAMNVETVTSLFCAALASANCCASDKLSA